MVHSTRPPVPTETFLVFRSLWIEGETCIWDINLAHLCFQGEEYKVYSRTQGFRNAGKN